MLPVLGVIPLPQKHRHRKDNWEDILSGTGRCGEIGQFIECWLARGFNCLMADGRGKARVCFCHSLSVIIIVTIALIRHITIAGGLMWSQALIGLLSQPKRQIVEH